MIKILYKPILIINIFMLLGGLAMAENQEILEINSAMMRDTYKIAGEGSLGSCFIVGKPFKKVPNQARYVLVTAAHVLEQMKGNKAIIYLRKKKDDSSFVKTPWEIQIRQDGKELWTKNKDGIDIAVMYVLLPKDIDIQLLPTTMFADDKILTDFEIHPGDELCCLGFPFGAEANESGFPILRSGRIASFPLVPTQKNESFLLDFEVFKGNSGGPVYFTESNRNYGGGTHIGKIQFLAGLVSKESNVTETVNSIYETKEQVYPLKLAVIIHASHILETINQLPELD